MCVLVFQTHSYVSEEILHMEAGEGLEKVQDALKVCSVYQATYHDRRANLAQYFHGHQVLEWDFQSKLIFSRLDMFTNQLENIQVSKPAVHVHVLVSSDLGGFLGSALPTRGVWGHAPQENVEKYAL